MLSLSTPESSSFGWSYLLIRRAPAERKIAAIDPIAASVNVFFNGPSYNTYVPEGDMDAELTSLAVTSPW